ncbi:MAG: nuclear transport factor 2 family protein [Acidobacteria bacterium]|nr:nuclear transport factor 2 family protein [Acidobacteriota bacterium]
MGDVTGLVTLFCAGNDATGNVTPWTFTGTRADGTCVEVHGCDVFTFRDGKIALKNSYRKNRTLSISTALFGFQEQSGGIRP